MSILRAFKKEKQKMLNREWDKIYVFVDIHDTIFRSDYGKGKDSRYYPMALRTLQVMSQHPKISLGIYSSTHPKAMAEYLDIFAIDKIKFDHVNENTEEKNTTYACFDKKPYFNVLIDDKAGFDPYFDWTELYEYLINEF
jgi:hypothetical protein